MTIKKYIAEQVKKQLSVIKENKTAEQLFKMFQDEDLIDDRREYDVEDLMNAYPDLSKEEAKKLVKKLQTGSNKRIV